MEKQITMTVNQETAKRSQELFKRIACMMGAPMKMLRGYYSNVLGRAVDNAEARVITEAQLAFLATVMPADMSILLRFAACAWFVIAVRKCKLYMKHKD